MSDRRAAFATGLHVATAAAVLGTLGYAGVSRAPMGGFVGSPAQIASMSPTPVNTPTLNSHQFPAYEPTTAQHPGAWPKSQLMEDMRQHEYPVPTGTKPTPGSTWIVGNRW
jgi:hypothetical protein